MAENIPDTPADAGASAQAHQQTQQIASQIVDQAHQQTKSFAASQKDRAAESLDAIAQALRQTRQQLQEQNQGALGQLADKGAQQVDQLSRYLHESDISQLVREVEDVGRRNPTLFIGGAFALGLAAARFLKSSSQTSGWEEPMPPPRQAEVASKAYGTPPELEGRHGA